jgi:putative spermidine/putrescine transport system ATP-binding protein
MSYLKLADLRKVYGGTVALEKVDLAVEQGEFVSLLGPSGCGKTTTLRIVAGLETADAGTVTLGGRDITALDPRRRDMGMVFQSYALFPNLTARENVAFGLKMRRTPPARSAETVRRMLDLVDLADRGDSYPHQLSGGQRQRIALARALAVEPTVLLLDNPSPLWTPSSGSPSGTPSRPSSGG